MKYTGARLKVASPPLGFQVALVQRAATDLQVRMHPALPLALSPRVAESQMIFRYFLVFSVEIMQSVHSRAQRGTGPECVPRFRAGGADWIAGANILRLDAAQKLRATNQAQRRRLL